MDEVKRTGRNTQGVTFAKPDKGDEILSIARNEEKDDPEEEVADNGTAEAGQSPAEPVNESNETAQSGENVNNVDEA